MCIDVMRDITTFRAVCLVKQYSSRDDASHPESCRAPHPIRRVRRENPGLQAGSAGITLPSLRDVQLISLEVAVNMMIAKLAAWHRLYVQLQAARLRLKEAQPLPEGDFVRSQLEEEVIRLRVESDAQLQELKGFALPASAGEQPGSHRG
jgi:hypothetical protein